MSARPAVLITGAARRLGRDVALHLATQGFDVAVHYRTSLEEALATVEELRSLGVQAAAFKADLSVESECRALLPRVVAHFGRVDSVVNNAAHFEHDSAATFSTDVMEAHWRANTAPAILLAQALHDHLRGRPQGDTGSSAAGCVINLLDQKLWNPNPDYFSYTLSKAALQTATVMLAQALAPWVRVCGVAPGVTLVSGSMSASEFDAAHRMTPLLRSSRPEDIARTVRFLIESSAITGTTVLVDGGQHLLAQPRDVMFMVRGDNTSF